MKAGKNGQRRNRRMMAKKSADVEQAINSISSQPTVTLARVTTVSIHRGRHWLERLEMGRCLLARICRCVIRRCGCLRVPERSADAKGVGLHVRHAMKGRKTMLLVALASDAFAVSLSCHKIPFIVKGIGRRRHIQPGIIRCRARRELQRLLL